MPLDVTVAAITVHGVPTPQEDLVLWRTPQPHKAVIILLVLKVKLERGLPGDPVVQSLLATQVPREA